MTATHRDVRPLRRRRPFEHDSPAGRTPPDPREGVRWVATEKLRVNIGINAPPAIVILDGGPRNYEVKWVGLTLQLRPW